MHSERVRVLPPAGRPLVTLAVSLHLPVFNAELVRSVEIKVLALYGEVGVGGLDVGAIVVLQVQVFGFGIQKKNNFKSSEIITSMCT